MLEKGFPFFSLAAWGVLYLHPFGRFPCGKAPQVRALFASDIGMSARLGNFCAIPPDSHEDAPLPPPPRKFSSSIVQRPSERNGARRGCAVKATGKADGLGPSKHRCPAESWQLPVALNDA